MSLPEVSSHCLRSPVWEQGGSSRKTAVVDLSLSSDEGDLIVDVSWDEEFARRLFDDLNHNFLWPSGDGKIIILSDSNEEEEAYKEKVIDAKATPSSASRFPAPTTSANDVNGTYKSNTPVRVTGGSSSSGEDETGLP
jgi:hypothetical protein